MPAGLKQTSSLIQISSSVTETGPNTFTVEQVDLQLNPLDQEVFVIQAVDIDLFPPSLVPGQSVATLTLSSTRRTTTGGIDAPNVVAAKRITTQEGATGSVTNEYMASDSPASNLDYIAIVATNDFFLNIEGAANLAALSGNTRVYGYRARADASVYAALVQSEALSA